jgi:8-oxo-dGTP diphosphatase
MIRVVAAVIEQRGQLLICQRRRGGLFEFKWEFPGGKIRRGETPRTALARELREELGVAASIGNEIFHTHYPYAELTTTVEIRFFAASRLFPMPRKIAFERMVWVCPGELPRYDFLPADRGLVARLARGDFSPAARK